MLRARHTPVPPVTDARRAGSGWGWWIATAIALGVIGIATLLPSGGQLRRFSSCIFCGDDALADAIRNVVLFLPLGFALGHATRYRARALLFAALVTASVEFVQQWIPGRDPSVGDMITNTTGAALGIGLVVWRSRWARPSGRFALAAAAAAALTFLVSGWLLTPVFPAGDYFGQWTANLGDMDWYRGRVLDARIGDVPIPSHRLSNSDRLVALLSRGMPVRVRAVTGPPVGRTAPLLSIFDARQRELFLIGPDAHGLVLRPRLRAVDLRLDAPDLLIPTLRLGPAGDTVTVAVWRPGAAYCVAVNGAGRCGLGFTVGTGWALVWYPPDMPSAVASVLTLFWIALLAAPVGFWLTRDWWSAGSVVVLAGSLAVVPSITGLLSTPLTQWLAAGFGLMVGAAAQRLLRNPRRA